MEMLRIVTLGKFFSKLEKMFKVASLKWTAMFLNYRLLRSFGSFVFSLVKISPVVSTFAALSSFRVRFISGRVVRDPIGDSERPSMASGGFRKKHREPAHDSNLFRRYRRLASSSAVRESASKQLSMPSSTVNTCYACFLSSFVSPLLSLSLSPLLLFSSKSSVDDEARSGHRRAVEKSRKSFERGFDHGSGEQARVAEGNSLISSVCNVVVHKMSAKIAFSEREETKRERERQREFIRDVRSV